MATENETPPDTETECCLCGEPLSDQETNAYYLPKGKFHYRKAHKACVEKYTALPDTKSREKFHW